MVPYLISCFYFGLIIKKNNVLVPHLFLYLPNKSENTFIKITSSLLSQNNTHCSSFLFHSPPSQPLSFASSPPSPPYSITTTIIVVRQSPPPCSLHHRRILSFTTVMTISRPPFQHFVTTTSSQIRRTLRILRLSYLRSQKWEQFRNNHSPFIRDSFSCLFMCCAWLIFFLASRFMLLSFCSFISFQMENGNEENGSEFVSLCCWWVCEPFEFAICTLNWEKED